jgi:DNA-directed RNA polymerase specialized sigma24 family protein
MTNAATAVRPKESRFYDPVVYLLGKLSGFKPYVGIPHEKVQDDVLRLAGIDPDNCPWPLRSTSSKKRDGLYRVVHFAWYHQTRQYRPEMVALCARPMDGERGEWALTALGVKRAKELAEKYDGALSVLSAGPNVTAQWIGERYELLVDRISRHLHRKMPRSAEFGKIDDHIHDFFADKISNDGFRKTLESGRSLPPSTVAFFARRSAYSDLRDEGREPVCRTFHGALTKNEIPDYDPSNWTEMVMPTSINTSEHLQVNNYAEHSENDAPVDTMDFLADPRTTEMEVNDMDAMENVLELLSQIIQQDISEKHDPDWHQQLMVDRFIHQMSIREIAEAHGLDYDTDRNKITLALARVRKAMSRRRDAGDFAEYLTH